MDLCTQLRDRSQHSTNGQNGELHASRKSLTVSQPVRGGTKEITTEGEESQHTHSGNRSVLTLADIGGQADNSGTSLPMSQAGETTGGDRLAVVGTHNGSRSVVTLADTGGQEDNAGI